MPFVLLSVVATSPVKRPDPNSKSQIYDAKIGHNTYALAD